MEINRRKFITTTSLSIIGLGITNSVLGNALNSNFFTTTTIAQKLREAAVKRRAGSFIDARAIYDEVIIISPSEIRAYDGIRKILLKTKYKELEVLQLYLNGMSQNIGNANFKERVAREYMRLSLGNKKFTEQLNENQDLLEKAKQYFEEAKLVLPTSEQIQKQLEKSERKIDSNANTLDARENVQVIEHKKENQHNFKTRFVGLTAVEVKDKLDELLTKATNGYRKRHICEIYKVYIKKLKKDGNIDLAAQMSKTLCEFDKKDSNALKLARNTCRKDKKYDVLESIERKNEIYKKTFWSKIALFDVLHKRYKYSSVGNTTEMKNILLGATNLKRSFYHTFECKIREIKLELVKNNMPQAFLLINTFGDLIIGIEAAHFIDRYIILCVQYFQKMNDYEKALLVISIGLKEDIAISEDTFMQKLKLINKNKDAQKPIHNE